MKKKRGGGGGSCDNNGIGARGPKTSSAKTGIATGARVPSSSSYNGTLSYADAAAAGAAGDMCDPVFRLPPPAT